MGARCQSPYSRHGEGTELCDGDKSTQAFLTYYGLSSPKTDTMESSPWPKFPQTRRRPSSAPAVRDETCSPVVSPSWLISPARRPRHVAGVTDQIPDRPFHVEDNRAVCTNVCKNISQGDTQSDTQGDTCADNNTSILAEELRESSTGDFYGDGVLLVDRGRMRVLKHKLRELARENALLRDAVRRETLVDGTGRRQTAQLRQKRQNLEFVAALRTAKDTVFQKTSRAQDKTRALQPQVELERWHELQQSVAGPGSKIFLTEGASDDLISDTASAASQSHFLPEMHDKLDVDAFTRSALDHSYKPCSASRLSTEPIVGVGSHRFGYQGQSIVDCNFDKATCIAGDIINLTRFKGGTKEGEKGRMKAMQEGPPTDQHRDNIKLDGIQARHGAVPETLLSREEEAVRRRDERAAAATRKQEDQLKMSPCFLTTKLCAMSGPDWATIKMRQDIARKQRIRERALQLTTSSSLPSRMEKHAAMHATNIVSNRNSVGGGLGSGKAREARPGVAIPKKEPEEIIRGIIRRQRRWEASLVAAKEALRTAVTRPRTPPMEKRRRIQEVKWRAKETAERAAREEEVKEKSERKRRNFLRQLARYRESTMSHTPRETIASRKKAEETRRRVQKSLHDEEKQRMEAEAKAARQREVSRAVRIYVERSEARRREKHGTGMPLDELVRQKQEEKRAEFRQRWHHNRRGLRQALRKRPNLLERQDQLAQLHYKQRAAEAQTARAFLKSMEGFEVAGRRAAAGSPSRSEGLARETTIPTEEKPLWEEENGERDSADGSSTRATRQDDGGGGFAASTQDGEINDIVAPAPHGGVIYDDKRLSSESTPLRSDDGGDGSGDSSGTLASGREEQTAGPPETMIK